MLTHANHDLAEGNTAIIGGELAVDQYLETGGFQSVEGAFQ
jgi:hypothetical protein